MKVFVPLADDGGARGFAGVRVGVATEAAPELPAGRFFVQNVRVGWRGATGQAAWPLEASDGAVLVARRR